MIVSKNIFPLKLPTVSFPKRYKQITLSIIVILMVTFFAFSNSLNNEFLNWDDPQYVLYNPLIKDLSITNIQKIFTTFALGNYHPLVLLSYAFEFSFYEVTPYGYHLTNLLLHIGCTLLVFLIILLISSTIPVALISALFFGIHPLHVESVVWITERKDVLSTLFFLLSILYYLFYLKKKSHIGIALLFFLLALLSKPMAVTLPAVLILLDYHLYKKISFRTVLDKWPFFLLSLVFVIITFIAQHPEGIEKSIGGKISIVENSLIACWGLIFYLLKTVMPSNLSALYPYPENVALSMPEYFLPPILLAIIVTLVYYSRRFTFILIFGFAFYFITILPVIKLIPLGGVTAIAADRYMYIPSIGIFYIFGVAFHFTYTHPNLQHKGLKILLLGVIGIFIFVLSVLTFQRNYIWRNSITLWSDVIKKYPQNALAHSNLGDAYQQQGLIQKAVVELNRTLTLDPDYATAHFGMASLYNQQGFTDKAITELKKAIQIKPDYVSAINILGFILREQGLLEEAISYYKTAAQFRPDSPDIFNGMGVAYYELGRMDEAVSAFKQALQNNLDCVDALFNLATVYDAMGLTHAAVEEYQQLVKINPEDSNVYLALGLIYFKLGNIPDAISQYKQALQITPGFKKAQKALIRAVQAKR